MEQFDLYDSNGNLINKTAVRGSKLNKDEYYNVVHIWIKNNKNEYLIQQRNKNSDIVKNQWATTSGAVIAGETSVEAAKREVFEEIGVNVDKKLFTSIKRFFINDNYANYIVDIYIVKANILIKDTVLDKLEVSNVKYANLNEIKELISTKLFWDYSSMINIPNYFDLIEKS